ncbi:hypothetical protein FALBO_17388 [Fusarium albosuccineum]|uniref:Uncharacterized protein n=1 Tax=Fusarium albosuccineum TaxID=1237068 RepID=A0A8H4JTB1_9HYPO|nr:hypothetical protein FALBO_17388 [Fusarium albosuccineum]
MPAQTHSFATDITQLLDPKPSKSAVIHAWVQGVELSKHHPHSTSSSASRRPSMPKQHPILAVHDPYTARLQNSDFEPPASSPDKQSTASRSSRVSTSTTRSKSPVNAWPTSRPVQNRCSPTASVNTPCPGSVQEAAKDCRGEEAGAAMYQKGHQAQDGRVGSSSAPPQLLRRSADQRELATIVETCSVARLWTSQNVNEASWNALGHCPLLKIALYPLVQEPSTLDADLASSSDSDSDSDLDDQQDGSSKPLDLHGIATNSPVTFWDITTARPRTDCVPSNVYGDMLESKKIASYCAARRD